MLYKNTWRTASRICLIYCCNILCMHRQSRCHSAILAKSTFSDWRQQHEHDFWAEYGTILLIVPIMSSAMHQLYTYCFVLLLIYF